MTLRVFCLWGFIIFNKVENLYLIKVYNETESFYKIGTTVHRYCRFYEIMKSGYEIVIIHMVFGIDCYKAWEAETYMQSIFSSYKPLIRFGGYTECFEDINILDYKDKHDNTLGNLVTLCVACHAKRHERR